MHASSSNQIFSLLHRQLYAIEMAGSNCWIKISFQCERQLCLAGGPPHWPLGSCISDAPPLHLCEAFNKTSQYVLLWCQRVLLLTGCAAVRSGNCLSRVTPPHQSVLRFTVTNRLLTVIGTSVWNSNIFNLCLYCWCVLPSLACDAGFGHSLAEIRFAVPIFTWCALAE